MDDRALLIAVRARLFADTGSGGLFANGAELVTNIYGVTAVPGASYPYIVVDRAGFGPLDAFTLNVAEVRFRTHVIARVDSGWDNVNAILARVYGSGNRSPTYGLHRHSLTLTGGWAATNVQFAGRTTDTETGTDRVDFYHVVDDWLTFMSKAAT